MIILFERFNVYIDYLIRFKDVSASDGSGFYYYNPCYPFDAGAVCTNAAVSTMECPRVFFMLGTFLKIK